MVYLFKIILVPAIIALITIAGRIWGAQVSGFLAGLPVIVGPILIFIHLDQGPEFATRSAEASLMGIVSLCLFALVYSRASIRHGVAMSLAFGLLAFASATALSMSFCPSTTVALVIVILVLCASLVLLPPIERSSLTVSSHPQEIALRMVVASALVVAITVAADYLGPRLSGLLAPFPVAGTIIAGFTHYTYGAPTARRVLRGFIVGLFGMAAFTFSMAMLLSSWSLSMTLVVGLSAAVLCGKSAHYACGRTGLS